MASPSAASRSAIVLGPPARIVAAGNQRSPSTIPRISPAADRHDIRRTMAPGVGSFSILSAGPRTGRYARLIDRVNLRCEQCDTGTMPIDSTELVPLGRTGLVVTRLGFGGASIGGLFSDVTEEDAIRTVRHAWDL